MLWLSLLLPSLAAPAVEPIRLDLGPEDGQVLEGFAEVTPYRSAHPAVSWTEAPKKARALSWLDPLADDQVQSGVLHVDLPPGDYAIAALFQERGFWYNAHSQVRTGLLTPQGQWVVDREAGTPEAFFVDPVTNGVRRPRFTPDNSPWERQIQPGIRWRTDVVAIGEGGIDLRVRGRELSALVLVPGSDVAELEVELALIDAGRKRAWLERTGVWPDPGVFATEGLIGVEPVALDGWPTPDGARDDVWLVEDLAPGERRVVQVAIHGSDDAAAVGLEGLPDIEARVFEVDWLDVKVSKRITRPTPHTLRPLTDGQLTAGQGLVPMVAVELSVDASAEPGLHQGALWIEREGERLSVPIYLRVRRLALAQAPVPWGFWTDLRGPIAALHGPNSEVAKARWRSEVALMRRWGVERISIRGAFRPGPRLNPDDAEYQLERIRWAVGAWRGENEPVPGDVQWHDPKFNLQNRAEDEPLQPVFSAEAKAFLARVFDVAAELQVSLYVSDEETIHHGPGRAPLVARRLQAIRELSGEVGLNVSSPHPAGWPNAAALADRVYTSTQPRIDPRDRTYFEGKRAAFWSYNLGWQREATGALPWLMQPEGLLIWHLNDSTAAPFNELARRRRYTMVMPAEDPSEAWANRRLIRLGHGGYDQRYYGTLAKLVTELADHRRARVQAEVDHACLLLQIASSGMAGLRFDSFDDRPMRDAESLQGLQDEIGDTAEALARWSKVQRDVRRGKAEIGRGAFLPERCVAGPRPVSPHADPADVPPLEAP